jgi:hypothetical protein
MEKMRAIPDDVLGVLEKLAVPRCCKMLLDDSAVLRQLFLHFLPVKETEQLDFLKLALLLRLRSETFYISKSIICCGRI